MPEPRITVVVAAAGAGKTTRIVHSIAETVKTRAPEEIVATTFTVKAANEVIERARAYLTEVGQADIAARLLGARFGTVNAICGHFAAEYALELGLLAFDGGDPRGAGGASLLHRRGRGNYPPRAGLAQPGDRVRIR